MSYGKLLYFEKLTGENLSRYLNKFKSTGLRKAPSWWSDCKCCKLFTFLCPTEEIMSLSIYVYRKLQLPRQRSWKSWSQYHHQCQYERRSDQQCGMTHTQLGQMNQSEPLSESVQSDGDKSICHSVKESKTLLLCFQNCTEPDNHHNMPKCKIMGVNILISGQLSWSISISTGKYFNHKIQLTK